MEEKLKLITEHALRSACDLQGLSLKSREAARNCYRKIESNEQNVLRITVDGLVAAIGFRLNEPIAGLSEEASYQIGLSASFIRTYFLVTDMLLNGDLVEALVLLRKQIEVLARILELEEKNIKELRGKTPNVRNILTNGTGRIYGHLSEVAHFSTPESTELLGVNIDGERCGPSLHPQFQEAQLGYMEMSQFTGIRFAQWMLKKLTSWYPEADFDLEHHIAFLAIESAVNAGVLVVPETPNA